MSDSDDSIEEERRRLRQQPPNPNEGLHPLFWDEIPEGAEQDVNWQALEALKNESTLEERAENFKVQGNNKLKVGLQADNKHVLREAIEFYIKGLALKCSDDRLNSILLSNKAHVESLIGNWRKSLQDSREAQKLDPSNAKAYFRGAKAAMQLSDYQLCWSQCEAGEAVDSKAIAQFSALRQEAERKKADEEQKHKALEAKREAESGPGRRLAEAIMKRGIRVCRPQVRLESRSRPVVDEDGLLLWPVLVMYPESKQQDAIEAFCEEDTFEAHMEAMFGSGAPPLPWDTRQEYTRESIELYYLSNAGRPLDRDQLVLAMYGKWPDGLDEDAGPQRYGEKAAKWQLIDSSLTLGQLMAQNDYVVPGIPLLFAVAKGTEYRKRFLSQNA